MSPRPVDRHGIHRSGERDGAVLVEVLPRAEYDWAHLPGALHLPLKCWDPEQVRARLELSRPVIVHCHDST